MATLCLTFWRTAKLFSKVAVPFYIPTKNEWSIWFFLLFANTLFITYLFDYSHPVSMKQNLFLKSFYYKTFLNIKIEKTVLWQLLYLSSSFDNYEHLFNLISDFLKVALLKYNWDMYRKLYIFQVYNLIGLKHMYWWNDHHS